MRRVRVLGPDRIDEGVVEDGVVVTERGERIQPVDESTLALPDP